MPDVLVRVDPVRVYRAANGADGEVRSFMRRLSVKTANHLQRKAPKNPRSNELHRLEAIFPRYANSFVTSVYGNQNGSGFRVGNLVNHAIIVEEGRSGSSKPQFFSWGGDRTDKSPRWHDKTKARPGTHFMRDTTTAYVARQIR